MLMRALLLPIAHETSGAARIRHSLRPLDSGGARYSKSPIRPGLVNESVMPRVETALIRPKSHCVVTAAGRGSRFTGNRAENHVKDGKMRRNFTFLLGTVAGACFTVLVTGPQGAHLVAAAKAAARPDTTYSQLNLFGDVFERIRGSYVEKPDDGKLMEGAINGMISSLDPHSRYMNAKGWSDMQETTHGEFGGLGIEVTMEDGLVKVVAPIDDTPARSEERRVGKECRSRWWTEP